MSSFSPCQHVHLSSIVTFSEKTRLSLAWSTGLMAWLKSVYTIVEIDLTMATLLHYNCCRNRRVLSLPGNFSWVFSERVTYLVWLNRNFFQRDFGIKITQFGWVIFNSWGWPKLEHMAKIRAFYGTLFHESWEMDQFSRCLKHSFTRIIESLQRGKNEQ